MPNHVHLVVRPTSDNDVAPWTRWLFTTQVRHYHDKQGTTVRLRQGRYKSFLVQDDHALLTALRYLERNALRAKLVVTSRRLKVVQPELVSGASRARCIDGAAIRIAGVLAGFGEPTSDGSGNRCNPDERASPTHVWRSGLGEAPRTRSRPFSVTLQS
jgi:hypothetical protein